ncbi:MAG TPA: hypothetical protein VM050_01750 [Patescibacteria group bacterium]|nr:hypothetical protein [Patescibacteria group bacterium]
MSVREDSKITWITCPDCGAKIGIVLSVGKVTPEAVAPSPQVVREWPPSGINERLTGAGVDLTLVDVEEGESFHTVTPKKFLGDLWGPINDTIRTMGGVWIRDGRQSRWEISKEEAA